MTDEEEILAVAHADEFRKGVVDRLTEELGRPPTVYDIDLLMTYFDGALHEQAGMKRDEHEG